MIIFSIPAMLRFADTTAVDSAAAEPIRGGLGRAVACPPDAVLLANTSRYTHRRRPSSPRTAVDQPPPTPSSVKRVAGRRRRGDRSVGSQRVARPAVAAVVFTSTQPIPSCGSVCGGSHVGPAQTSSATLIEGRQQSAPSSGRPGGARRPRTIARVHSTSFPQYCPPGPHCFCAVEWDASYVSEVPRRRCGAAAWLRSFPATSSRLADGRYELVRSSYTSSWGPEGGMAFACRADKRASRSHARTGDCRRIRASVDVSATWRENGGRLWDGVGKRCEDLSS